MLKKILFVALTLALIGCKQEKVETKTQVVEGKRYVQTLNYKELQPFLNRNDDKNYVVNFWATWCAPCVKELPYFEELTETFKDQNLEVLLVSLDFPKKKDTKLLPFLKKKNIKSPVVLLDDANEDFWIKDISEEWSGALPATLIYNKNKRKFFEQSFTRESLHNEIKTFLNP